MIYLLPSLSKIQTHIVEKSENFGLLLTPSSGIRQHFLDVGSIFAAENECFTKGDKFDLSKYLDFLRRLIPFQNNCLFATAPDVVADAKATWERSEKVLEQIRNLGFPAALVAQDGMEDLPIHWHKFDALFVGGSTAWKLSENSFWLIREAKKRGKWAHLGRVNSKMRLRIAEQAGCDSADGTYLAFAPKVNLPKLENWLNSVNREPSLKGFYL